MEEANDHMAAVLNEIQERLFTEDKQISKEKAVARIRAKIPPPQTLLDPRTGALTKKGKARYHKVAGPESSGDSLADEEEEPLEHGQE